MEPGDPGVTHPEIMITTPQTSRSGMWELSTDGRSTAIYDDFWLMADYLAAKFADPSPEEDDDPGDDGQPDIAS
jgi:hypothetical protein